MLFRSFSIQGIHSHASPIVCMSSDQCSNAQEPWGASSGEYHRTAQAHCKHRCLFSATFSSPQSAQCSIGFHAFSWMLFSIGAHSYSQVTLCAEGMSYYTAMLYGRERTYEC